MHESPSTSQLLDAVIAFLNDVATPQLNGHAQFHARVSANALALIARELAGRERADAQAIAFYHQLLGKTGEASKSLEALEAAICDAIKNGDMSLKTPHLLTSLRAVTCAQLAIDQPNYSGLEL
jgi:hypothetical protein